MSTLAVNSLTPSTGTSISIPNFVPSSQFSHRNKIINGKMEIAQRGTSFAAIASGVYTLDRWLNANTSSAVVTISQQTDVPSNNEFQNSLRVAVTTADTSIVSGDVFALRQRIEGYNARDLIGRTFTMSFWVRSSKTGTHCVAFQNAGFNRVFVAEYTISAANTWEYKSVTVSGGLITAGTWDWTNGSGLDVSWALVAGSSYQVTAGSWVTPGDTSGRFSTANQVNCMDTVGNIFAITGVQLEAGSVATPFEHRPYGFELASCQRYYETGNFVIANAITFMPNYYKVTKRAAPSSISINSGTATWVSSDTAFWSTTATVGPNTANYYSNAEL